MSQVHDLMKYVHEAIRPRHGVLHNVEKPDRTPLGRWFKGVITHYDHFRDGTLLRRFRERIKSGSREAFKPLRVGPNEVHVLITRGDGTVQDLGLSKNLLTNIGRDLWAGMWGFQGAGTTLASYVSTGIGATSITDTGSVMTASNLASPQLGVAGMRVYAAPHTTTNPVVWGNAISNTTHVVTIDQWWKFAAAAGGSQSNPPITGTTPTSGDAYVIAPGGLSAFDFMGISTDSGAASASDTALASEVSTNGGSRAFAAYAHSFGGTTLTLTNALSFSGTLTAVHKGGLFGSLTGGPLLYETVFSSPGDFTVGNGDTATLTWTLTPSG